MGAVVFTALLVGGALLFAALPVVGTVFMIASVVPLGYALLGGWRRRRR